MNDLLSSLLCCCYEKPELRDPEDESICILQCTKLALVVVCFWLLRRRCCSWVVWCVYGWPWGIYYLRAPYQLNFKISITVRLKDSTISIYHVVVKTSHLMP